MQALANPMQAELDIVTALMTDLAILEVSATDSAAAEDAKRIGLQQLREELAVHLESLGRYRSVGGSARVHQLMEGARLRWDQSNKVSNIGKSVQQHSRKEYVR
jgi:hypothetical protein